jgi:hypothetical protein
MIDSGNPFSTRHTRPGAIPYRLPDSVTMAQLVERLRRHKWWGQILGPHGAGKTTLLHSLLPALSDAGRQVEMFTVHAGQRNLEISPQVTSKWDSATQVMVDGYEQLSWLARRQLQRRCRSRAAGLLITTHRSLGLPTVLHVQPSCKMVTQLVADLTRQAPIHIHEDDVRRCFQQQQGNVREAFFALYDLYERRRRRSE